MKPYPSIPKPSGKKLGIKLHTFEKLDGSNLRFEWSKKRGWHKSGTRRRLLDETDDIFGPAVPLFKNKLADKLESVIKRQCWQSVTVYAEYYGPRSFAGVHVPGDEMELTLFDVAPYKKGILPPTEFLDLFGDIGPHYLGYMSWNQEFLETVASGELDGASFEGVVGKGTRGKLVVRFKAKSRLWIKKVRERYTEEEARKIINS